jgi:dienelactone hydrolase
MSRTLQSFSLNRDVRSSRIHASQRTIQSLVISLSITLMMFGATVCSAQFGEVQSPNGLRTLNDHAPFVVPESKEAWLSRRTQVLDQMRVSLGMVPMPKLAPLSPNIYGRHEGDGFAVEKVTIETFPGFYLTGSLFTPSGDLSGKSLPGVLNPHGHWDDGRLYQNDDKYTNELYATGAERFEGGARNHIQGRCVQLARMGCVSFAYDMIGYADSKQISQERAHEYGITEVNADDESSSHLLFSPQAEMYGQSVLAMQSIHSVVAVDFLQSLPYVDDSRIAITGASGGGTQSFVGAALDERIIGAFPAVMVSTGMQGGCTCENACGFRTFTGNVEMAATIAPRAQCITAADDWTRNVANDGFPELKKLYALMGAEQKMQLFAATHFPHNYNHVSRVAMYGFMNQLFGLGLKEPILESDFEPMPREILSVWDADHPQPESGLGTERSVVHDWQRSIDTYFDDAELDFNSQNGRDLTLGWQVITQPAENYAASLSTKLQWHLDQPHPTLIITDAKGHVVGTGLMKSNSGLSRHRNTSAKVEWTSFTGVHIGLSNDLPAHQVDGALHIELQVVDPVSTELTQHGEQSLVPEPRPSASYTYGYNAPAIVRKLAIMLRAIDYLSHEAKGQDIELESSGVENFAALATSLRRPNAIKAISLHEFNSFSFRSVDSIRDANFLPNALRYQDLSGLQYVVKKTTKVEIR